MAVIGGIMLLPLLGLLFIRQRLPYAILWAIVFATGFVLIVLGDARLRGAIRPSQSLAIRFVTYLVAWGLVMAVVLLLRR